MTQFAKAFTNPGKVEMVTFHQSFAYEEFVEGVKPVIHEGRSELRSGGRRFEAHLPDSTGKPE